MKEVLLTITKKGQVTIPKEAREHLGVSEKGNNRKIALVLTDEGTAVLKKPRYPDLASIRGAAGKLPKPLPWEEVRERAREDHLKDKLRRAP